jgi:hypothetical protein
MEYAASLVKIKPNMKLYMRDQQLCMELTNQIKPFSRISNDFKKELDKIMTQIKGTPEIITSMENNHVVVYIKDFHSDMINNVG